MKRIRIAVLVLAVLLGALSGCAMESPESLYQLPKLPAAYEQLQTALEEVLDQGAEYLTPSTGMSRQPVQMADLDGDGAQEAVALFRTAEEDYPLHIYIFKELDGIYRTVGLIRENGVSIESISFADLDGTGHQEILLGLSAGQGALKILSVYSLMGDDPVCVLKNVYSAYTCFDLDGDGVQEVLMAQYDSATQTAVMECYPYRSQGMELSTTVELSGPVTGVTRIRTGNLLNDVPALFVTSALEGGGSVTDILACRYGRMMNLTPSKEPAAEDDPAQAVMGGLVLQDDLVGATDLDGDGVYDMPRYRSLGGTGDENYQVIDWYNYDLEGNAALAFTTFHRVISGWYLEIPQQWDDGTLGVRTTELPEGGNTRGLTFYRRDEGGDIDLLTVYLLSGVSRNRVAEKPGRFIVYEMPESILAAELGANVPEEYAIAWEDVLERMHLVKTDWITGEIN